MNKNIKIGKNKELDKTVILNYPTRRKIKNRILIIGDNVKIRSGTVIYEGSHIGNNFESGHNVVIREENMIGNNVSVWSNTVIDYGCLIGNNVKIHANSYIAQFTTIEDEVFIAPGVIISNDLCPPCTKCMKGPTIKRGAKIGINVTILPHLIIGEFSLIGAGSVVSKDIPAYSLVYGASAKVVKKVTDIRCKKGIIEKPYKYA